MSSPTSSSAGSPEGGRSEGDGAVVIVGAPGSGKSTVGELLAERLGIAFRDVDQVIEAAAGKPVGEIFADEGEPAFRALEVETTLRLLSEPGVLSLGGGAVISEKIRQALVDHEVIWLQVSASQAVRRVGMTEARPLLLGNVRGRLIKLLNERTPLYAAVATRTVATDDHEPEQVVETIVTAREADHG